MIGGTDRADKCVAFQQNLNKREKCGNRNPMKGSAGKCQILLLGKNNPLHLYTLGADQQEGYVAEKFLEFLVIMKLSDQQ